MPKILQGVTITNNQDGRANGEVQFFLADQCESRVYLFPLEAIFLMPISPFYAAV
jgi:hypothetical protein